MELVKTRIKIELCQDWLVKLLWDEYPVDLFIEAAKKFFTEGVREDYSDPSSCEIVITMPKDEEFYLDGWVRETLQEVLKEVDEDELEEIFKIEIEEVKEPEEQVEKEKEQPEGQREDPVLPHTATRRAINALVGANSFKALMEELEAMAPQFAKHNAQEAFYFQSYLFAVGDGCGLSTYLQLFSELIKELGLFDLDTTETKEFYIEGNPEGIKNALEQVGVYKALICFDISEWMDKIKTQEFRRFLKNLEERQSERIFAFRIPYVDEHVLKDIQGNLRNILFIRSIPIPPFTQDELSQYTENRLKNYGFTMAEDGWGIFNQRIIEEKSDGVFYGLQTMDKVIREMLYKKQLSNTRRATDDLVIEEQDIKALATFQEDGHMGAMEQLQQLVGIAAVKERIQEILIHIQLSMKQRGIERPCLHMRFVGNPGTGKTTVARLLGKVFKEKGILSGGHLFEHHGRDFCGRYVGETAPRTTAMCRDAYGSVLFIDEAYSLFSSSLEGSNDFGREALDVLVAQMENHKTDLIVVMAGYPNEMETLMRGNSGLASRMPYLIEFPNFSKEELFAIFMSMAKGRFSYDDGFREAVETYFLSLRDETTNSKEFSNARFVRNLFERTWGKAALRSQFDQDETLVLTRCDFEKASVEREFSDLLQRRKQTIGF